MAGSADEREIRQMEVDRNYEAFLERLPELLKTDAHRFALMRDGDVVACFDTSRDAMEAGRKMFGNMPFSVQEITDRAIDLGYLSHAGSVGVV